MRPVLGVIVKDLKAFFRSKTTVFWTIAFPIMIMLLFSAIFSSDVSFRLAVLNQDQGELGKLFLKGLEKVNATEVFSCFSEEEAKEKVSSGEVVAAIIVPENFSSSLLSGKRSFIRLYTREDPQLSSVAVSLVSGYVSSFNKVYREKYLKALSRALPLDVRELVLSSVETLAEPVSLKVDRVSELQYRGQWIATMIVYTFLFSGMVSASASLAYEKISGNIKRIRVSPASPWSILSGKIFGGLLTLSLSQAILLAVTMLWLRPEVNWSWELIPLIVVGDMASLSLGLLITEASPDPKAASEAVTAVAVIIQFFCGIYFPLEFLPEPLRQVANLIPFTWANEALRGILLRGYGLGDLTPSLLGLTALAVVATAASAWLFPKWAESS